jgi:hypothetical protein
MSWSFGFNILICLIAGLGAWLDHGETWVDYRSASTKKERRIKFAKLLVIWGSTVVSVLALPITYLETVVSERSALETKQVASNAANKAAALDPKKQPVTTIAGYAFLHLRGTNLLRQTPEDAPFGRLSVGKFPQVTSNQWKILLISSKPTRFWNKDAMTLAFEFRMDPMHPLSNASTDEAGAMDDWDVICLDAAIVGDNRELIDGWATVTINSTISKKWLFPPQTPYLPVFTSMATNDGFTIFPVGEGGHGGSLFPGNK